MTSDIDLINACPGTIHDIAQRLGIPRDTALFRLQSLIEECRLRRVDTGGAMLYMKPRGTNKGAPVHNPIASRSYVGIKEAAIATGVTAESIRDGTRRLSYHTKIVNGVILVWLESIHCARGNPDGEELRQEISSAILAMIPAPIREVTNNANRIYGMAAVRAVITDLCNRGLARRVKIHGYTKLMEGPGEITQTVTPRLSIQEMSARLYGLGWRCDSNGYFHRVSDRTNQ